MICVGCLVAPVGLVSYLVYVGGFLNVVGCGFGLEI